MYLDTDEAERMHTLFTYFAKTIQGALEIDCCVYDGEEYKFLGNPACQECMRLQMQRSGEIKCKTLHGYGAYQSGRWGGKYEYLCDLGLAFIAVHLPTDGENCQAFILGPFRMVDLRELYLEDVPRMFYGMDTKELGLTMENLLYVPSQKVTPVGDLARMIANNAVQSMWGSEELRKEVAAANDEFFDVMYRSRDTRHMAELQLAQEEKLLRCIDLGDREAAQKILNDILGNIYFSLSGDMETIRLRVTELLVLLLRRSFSAGSSPEEMFSVTNDYMRRIQKIEDVETLSRWLSQTLTSIMRSSFAHRDLRHVSVIKRVNAHISQHFMEKITLNDLAEVADLSVSYLSKIYKEETGESLSNYINNVRIGVAVELLKDRNISLSEVSCRVGFEDQSYFTKVFKRIQGISPGKFREKYM